MEFPIFYRISKKISARLKGENRYVPMAIPNREVSYIYHNTIHRWFEKRQRKFDMQPFYQAKEEMNTEKMEEELSNFLAETINYYDYGESYYHGFLAGLFRQNGKYRILSNRETGLGRRT